MKRNISISRFAVCALFSCAAAMPAAVSADSTQPAQSILSGVPSIDADISDFIIENNGGNEEWELKTMAAWSVGNTEDFKYFHLESAYIEDWSASHDDWIFIPATLPAGRVKIDLDFEYLTSADSGTGFGIEAYYGSAATSDAMTSLIGAGENCKSPTYLWFNKATFSSSATVDGGSGYLGLHVTGQLRRDDWINILTLNLSAAEAEGEAAIGSIDGEKGLSVTTDNGSLTISGADGETISLFTIDGQLVKRFTATGVHTLALQKGIYIVKTRNRSIKAIIL